MRPQAESGRGLLGKEYLLNNNTRQAYFFQMLPSVTRLNDLTNLGPIIPQRNSSLDLGKIWVLVSATVFFLDLLQA